MTNEKRNTRVAYSIRLLFAVSILALMLGVAGCSHTPPTAPGSITATIPSPKEGPDLLAHRVWIGKAQAADDAASSAQPGLMGNVSLRVGDKVVFNYSIQNLGTATAPAGSYTVELLLNGKRLAADPQTAGLEPGKFATYTVKPGGHHWIADKAGVHTYQLVVAPLGNLKETSLENNALEGQFSVAP